MHSKDLDLAAAYLGQGKIIAYPTEAVYGIGCDPLNEQAVSRLLKIKQRDSAKGMILIASTWQQVSAFIKPLPPERMLSIHKTWPGPVTWVFPATREAPSWITGQHQSIAIRITSHPIAAALCSCFQRAIVSTSANIASESPAKTSQEVVSIFGNEIDLIVEGEVGKLEKPTPIYDALTGKMIRA